MCHLHYRCDKLCFYFLSLPRQPAQSQVPLQLYFLVLDVLKENLPSVLDSLDERPETAGSTTAVPKFPVCIKGV